MCLAMHETKKNFLSGSYWQSEYCDWGFKLMWTMSAPFRKIHSELHYYQLISDQSTSVQHEAEDGCGLLATWSMTGHGLLSHSGYVSIYDIKMEYPITVSFRRVPVGGARAHLCPSLFLFSFCCAWSSLSLSLSHLFFFSAEKFVEMYYLQLWKKKLSLSPFLFSSSCFFPSSCNILVFTVVFPPCIYKAVLTLK